MFYSSILDSHSNLNNFKNRNGLKITSTNTVSIYSAQTKLNKFLTNLLTPHFSYKADMDMIITKIVDRCEDVETIEAVKEFAQSITVHEFINVAKGKIRPFFKAARVYMV